MEAFALCPGREPLQQSTRAKNANHIWTDVLVEAVKPGAQVVESRPSVSRLDQAVLRGLAAAVSWTGAALPLPRQGVAPVQTELLSLTAMKAGYEADPRHHEISKLTLAC